jgi:hypothetical protein
MMLVRFQDVVRGIGIFNNNKGNIWSYLDTLSIEDRNEFYSLYEDLPVPPIKWRDYYRCYFTPLGAERYKIVIKRLIESNYTRIHRVYKELSVEDEVVYEDEYQVVIGLRP